MHEIELGIWKALFTHIVHMLVFLGGDSIQKFNEQYVKMCTSKLPSYLLILVCISFRQIPTFGQSTICKFHKNASAMKKLAAWDFEDLLQV